MTRSAVAQLDEIDEISDGRCPSRPVRLHFGITSFGVNAWTGREAGDRIINEHDEAEQGEEELYLVQRGRARFELCGPLAPLYEAGEYAEAADRGRELINGHPDYPVLLYNVACCESLAGQAADAIEHLRRAIERSDRCRSLAASDRDFDPAREDPAFKALVP